MQSTSQRVMSRIVLAASVIAAGALGAAFAFSHRLYGSPDEMAHVDYVWQLWNGRFPVYEDGIQMQPGFGYMAHDQWVSQHPPLFYALAAPFAGPLIDHGHYLAGGYAVRAVNAVLAGVLVVAVVWLAREVAPTRRRFALAAGVVTAVHPAVVNIAGLAYNEIAFLVPATALLATTVRMIRRGPSRGALIAFAGFTALALLARASAIVVVGSCGLVLLACLLRMRPLPWRHVLGLAAAGLFGALASGWFYLRNLENTGNLVGTRLAEDIPYLRHRIERPLLEVLTNGPVWRGWHDVWGAGVVPPGRVALVLVALPVLTAVAVLGVRVVRRRSLEDAAVGFLLVGLGILIVIMQAQYVAQRGGASFRYLMPLVPLTGLAVAWAVTAVRRLQPLLLPAWVTLALVPTVIGCGRALVWIDPRSDAPVFPGATAVGLVVGGMAVGVALLGILTLADDRTAEPSDGEPRDVFAADPASH